MISSKAPYASLMHGDIKIGENRLNDWFEDPLGLLVALQQAGLVIPGDLDSRIFQLISFNGPMYKVFTDEQIDLWKRWVLSLPETGGKQPLGKKRKKDPPPELAYDHMRIVVDMLRARQQGASGHRVRLQGPDPDNPGQPITQPLHWWFDLGANLVGDNKAEQLKKADALLLGALSDEVNGWIVKGNSMQSPLVTAMATGFGDMAEAYREIAPGSGGLTYLACLVNWIEAFCPIGPPSPKMVAHVMQTRQRIKRYPWGMGKVH
jgi:hypothetical protein